MGRGKDTNDFVKGEIMAYKDCGHSQVQIAKKLKIYRCAVQNVLKNDDASVALHAKIVDIHGRLLNV